MTNIAGTEVGTKEITTNTILTIKIREVLTNMLKVKTQSTGMIIITHTNKKITKNMILRNMPNIKLMININVIKIMIKGMITQMFKKKIYTENIGLSPI